ncbi:MAG: RNA pseudouridine synthase [Treponema sp.]|nr:RNA pseudouridine synthase [Treponema sp.]
MIIDFSAPQIITAEKDFLVVYKPPGMHSAPLAKSPGENLVSWCAEKHPEIALLPGRKAGEGGLIHRLDFHTQGLLLFARTQAGMESLLLQQREGKIVKEYSALTERCELSLSGFPEKEPAVGPLAPRRIASDFRAYGPGRKAVRPVEGDEYVTEITESRDLEGVTAFKVLIREGFRHQIRCHLAWCGFPILNDGLYGGSSFGSGILGLRACGIELCVPLSSSLLKKEKVKFSIPELKLDDL